MEEVVEELRKHAEDIPVALDLPTEDDLLEVEESIFLQLPKEYREFLSTVSDLVIGPLEPATVADPHAHTYLPELAAEQWAIGLPRHLFPICVTPKITYAMDPDGVVVCWQDGDFTDENWESIWEWAIQVWLAAAY